MPQPFSHYRRGGSRGGRYACHDKQNAYDRALSYHDGEGQNNSEEVPEKPVMQTQKQEPPEVVYVEEPQNLFTLENLIKFSFWKNFFGL